MVCQYYGITMTAKSTFKKYAGRSPRPDRYSDKTEGKIRQTLRLSPEQNQLIRAVAEAEGLSINTWAVRLLMRAAKAHPHTKPKPRKRVKLG
jgi:predicted HicB family RNase H-like nuclease